MSKVSREQLRNHLMAIFNHANSDEVHGLQTENFNLYLIWCGLGNLAELALRMMGEWRK